MEDQSPKPGKTPPKGGECDKLQIGDERANVAGTDQGCITTTDNEKYRLGEKAIDWKASKRVFVKHGVTRAEQEMLSILWMYCEFTGKQDIGCNIQDLTEWSGKGYKWVNTVKRLINRLIETGHIERVAFGKGFRLLMTAKGSYILKCWEFHRAEVIRECQARVVIYQLKKETKRLNLQRLHNIRNSKGQFEASKG